MSAKDLNYLSAIEVCSLYRSRALSPVELLESFIQRAEEIDETVNPFTDKYLVKHEFERRNRKNDTSRGARVVLRVYPC